MKKILFALILLFAIPKMAYCQYYYCAIHTVFVEYPDGNIKPFIPVETYSNVGYSELGYYSPSSKIPESMLEESIICYIHVKDEDIQAIKEFSGFIGDTKSDIINNEIYSEIYPYKVKDIKRQVNDEGNVTEYEGEDKDDPACFTQFTDME